MNLIEYGKSALRDVELYKAVVEHRRRFYHLGYVDYDKDYPQTLEFIPSGEVMEAYRRDYNENMVDGYIYGNAIPFDELILRLTALRDRIREIRL